MTAPGPFDCSALDERLLDYLYDELPADEREALEAHVAGCTRCAAELSAFRRVRQAARAIPLEEPSPQITTRLIEAAAGRNVVPLPLPNRTAETRNGVAQDDVERSVTATERILAAARARVVAAPLERVAMAAAPPAASPASGGAVTVPLSAPRRRRWYGNPAFAAAASLVMVGLGSAWFLSFNREPAMPSAPQLALKPVGSATPEPTTSPATIAPSAAPPPATPTETARAEQAVEELRQRTVAVAPLPAMRAAKSASAPSASARFKDDLTDGDEVAFGSAPASAAGGAGTGSGHSSGLLGKGRAGQPGGAVPPAPARKSETMGVTLHADEKRVLDESVVAAGEAEAKKREAPPASQKIAQGQPAHEEDARERSYAPPPPPRPLPSSPAAAAPVATHRASGKRADADDALAAAEGSAGEALGATGAMDKAGASQPAANAPAQTLRRQAACPEFVAAYRQVKAANAGRGLSAAEHLRAADCYAEVGQIAQAREEYAALAASHPEMQLQIDQRLARLTVLENNKQLAQRRAAESQQQAPPAKAKAARSKGKSAADVAPAAPAF